MRGECRRCEIAALDARGLVIEKSIEDVTAGAATPRQRHALAGGEIGERFAEAECARVNAGLHVRQALASAADVGFVRNPRQARAKADTLDPEVKLNAIGA